MQPEVGDEAAANPPVPGWTHAVPFRDLGVDEVICTALEAAGIVTSFPIQALTLPLAIDGQDIIGQARTGTGKTLAFGIPLLHRLATTFAADRAAKEPTALVVVPTRELAIQVAEDIKQAGLHMGARVLTVYGGRAYEPQLDALKAAGIGTSLSGTPRTALRPGEPQEPRPFADPGPRPRRGGQDARPRLPAGRGAPARVYPEGQADHAVLRDDARRGRNAGPPPCSITRRPTNIRAEEPDETAPPPLTRQFAYRTHQLDKIEVLARILQAKDRGLSAMVFCQTKRAADQVATALGDRGFAVATVHGDLGQAQRERALRAFRGGKVDVLVATDVAARGIDIDDVTHVINYECPDDEKAYVHRIGRTGRAGRAGVAVTFVDWRHMQRWKLISDALGLGQPEPAETYSTSEHLFSELSIPPGVTGTLPHAMRGARAGLSAEAEEDLGETGRTRSPRGRTRSRSGSRPRDGAPAREPADPQARNKAAGAEAAPARARRRRRTRAGSEVTKGAAREVIREVPPESSQQAS